jgi:hypothetical protein
VESGLAITFDDLKKAVGYYLGITADSSLWSTLEASEVAMDIDAGLRMVYKPPLLPGQTAPYAWKFMKPVTVLTTVADQGDYDAPEDFGGFHGPGTFAPFDGSRQINVIDEVQIRAWRQAYTASARPQAMAFRAKKGTDAASGTRYTLLLHPTPDGEYVITYRYIAIPPRLSDNRPYPLGGALHGEMFLAAARAAAEKRIRGGNGPEYEAFLRELASSVALEQSQAPDSLGYCGDRSDEASTRPYDDRTIAFTYNGVEY